MIRRLVGDTLFRRLFILMWAALVGSHLLAFSTVMLIRSQLSEAPAPPPGPMRRLPTLPSLPPGFADMHRPEDFKGPRHAPPDDWRRDDRPPFERKWEPPGLPGWLIALDYAVRLVVIGAAAWWGARWISRPMHDLSRASQDLATALDKGQPPPKLDETGGTIEVQETAQVFNGMATRLHQQFRTRGLMMAAISHDLRTPLTRIRMRMEGFPDESLAQRCISDIREMNQLIDTSMEVFRGGESSEPTQAIDIHALLQSITDDLIEQGQPVSFEGEPAVARAKPLALSRVVVNLITNAVRYGQTAHVSVAKTGQQVVITVDDDGPGLPASELNAVFEPYYRVEQSRNRDTGGAGLGLYIARDLIAKQGGALTLANRAEGGLRAEVRLPL